MLFIDAHLILHNATNSGYFWQWCSQPKLATPGPWPVGLALGEIKGTPLAANDLWFTPIICTNPPEQFFWAGGSPNEAYISDVEPIALRPKANGTGGSNAWFKVSLDYWPDTPVRLNYTASGTAKYGLDYTTLPACTTNANGAIVGSILISNDLSATNFICPLYRTNIGFDVEATFALLPVGDTNQAVTTDIRILDNYPTNTISVVATNIQGMTDLGYYSPSNCLIVSLGWSGGDPYNFGLVLTNGSLSNWSSLHGMQWEVNIATVKVSTNGFTAGYMFFLWEEYGGVGWVAANGTNTDVSWQSVPVAFGSGLGDLYFDQTGLWGNCLLVIGGPLYGTNVSALWRIEANGTQSAIVTNLPTAFPEGLLTLPNDVTKYGPWAGKLITSDEMSETIYSIDTNGVVQPWYIGVTGQKFLLIPEGQNLYCMDGSAGDGWVIKVSKDLFKGHEGDILAFQCPEQQWATFPAGVFIIHWNGTNFETLPLLFGDFAAQLLPNGFLERGDFAPFDMAPVR